jgi:hypothetical protein
VIIECGALVEWYWKRKATSPRDACRTATSPTIISIWNGLLWNLAFLGSQLTAWSVKRLPLIYEHKDCDVYAVLFFFRETWSFALKGGVTLKAVGKKVKGKMVVSRRNEGTGESCVMKHFMICTHQLIFQITYGTESSLTVCLPLALIWAKWIHFTRALHCSLSWAG